MLRHNIPVPTIIKQLRRTQKCSSCIMKDNIEITSCADGIGKHMKDYYENKEILSKIESLQALIHKTFNNGKTPETKQLQSIVELQKCPSCGSTNIEPTRCATCRDCGVSRC